MRSSRCVGDAAGVERNCHTQSRAHFQFVWLSAHIASRSSAPPPPRFAVVNVDLRSSVVVANPLGQGRRGLRRPRLDYFCALAPERNDLNAARSSDAKSAGSSHAAKWPPRSTWLK